MTLGCGRAILGEWLSELGGVAERPCESGRATLEEWKSELVGVARRPGGGSGKAIWGRGFGIWNGVLSVSLNNRVDVFRAADRFSMFLCEVTHTHTKSFYLFFLAESFRKDMNGGGVKLNVKGECSY